MKRPWSRPWLPVAFFSLLALVLLVGLVVLPARRPPAAQGASGAAPAAADYVDQRGLSEVRIAIKGFAFVPQKVRVSRGARIVWTNEDRVAHLLVSDRQEPGSATLAILSQSLVADDSFTLVLDAPGEYPYHCDPHPSMRGSIVVE